MANARLGLYVLMGGVALLVADTLTFTKDYVRPLVEKGGLDIISIAGLAVLGGLYLLHKRRIG